MSKRLIIDSELATAGNARTSDDWSWPVKHSQYDTPITNFIEWTDQLHELINVPEQMLSAFYISKPGLIKDISYIAAAYLDITLARQNGLTPEFNADKYLYEMVSNDSYPHSAPTEIVSTPHPVGVRARLRNRVARYVRNRRFRQGIKTHTANFSIGSNQLTSEISPSGTQSLRRTHEDVLRSRPSTRLPADLADLVELISNKFVGEIESITGSTSQNFSEHIKWISKKYLTDGWKYTNSQDLVAGLPSNTKLFTGTGGGLAARITSYQFLRAGLDVVRTTHGGDSPMFTDVMWPATEFPFATTYVAYGEVGASSLISTINQRPDSTIPHYTKQVVAAGSKSHSTIHNSLRNAKPRLIRNVTVIAGSFSGPYPVMPHMKLHDLVYLDWHRRLLTSISQYGYSVTSKRHPKGRLVDRNLFDGIVDHELISTPMSAVQESTDAYVVDFPASAFMEALCTLKPVVLIDMGVRRMKQSARVELQKSVQFIEATFDEYNRIKIDETQLRNAIESPVDVDAREKLINDYLLRPSDDFQSIYS